MPHERTAVMFSHFVDGSCSSDKSFTAQQIARMHCYLDLVHSHAIVDNKPSAIPLPMQVKCGATIGI